MSAKARACQRDLRVQDRSYFAVAIRSSNWTIESARSGQPGFVFAMRHRDSVNQRFEASRLAPAVLLVLQVDVMHDLRDVPQRRVSDLEAGQQHLEGAELALMRVLAVEHVEAPPAAPFRASAAAARAVRRSPPAGRPLSPV